GRLFERVHDLLGVADVKIVFLADADTAALTHERFNVAANAGAGTVFKRGDVDDGNVQAARQASLNGPDGHQDQVVAILSHGGPLFLENADDPAGGPTDSQRRAQRLFAGVHVVDDGLTE